MLYSWIGSGMVEDWCYNCRECSFHLYFFLLDPPFASYFWFFLFSIHCVERSLGVGSFLVPSQCSLEKKNNTETVELFHFYNQNQLADVQCPEFLRICRSSYFVLELDFPCSAYCRIQCHSNSR